MGRKSRGIPEINAGSMADIAFLLLVFFLVTTTMDQQKGLRVQLPPYPDPNVPPPVVEQNDRNVLEVLVNSGDQLLVERQPLRIEALTEMTKKHIQNEGRDPNFADSSQAAIVSLKNDRGTSVERYVQVYNELIRAYNEARDEYSKKKYGRPYKDLIAKGEEQKAVKKKYPMKISEAEPVEY
ncbi:MAG: biopolymer transporter ExbD [Bacteroidia bacterium]|nr:biopolymer transporter ExbD [Bacteroidia bacterium]